MSAFQIALANLRHNVLGTFLSVLLMALGIGTVLFVMEVSKAVNDGFTKDIRDIDMVVGAKGSPLQLILSAVYHMDSPTGNISRAEAEKLSKHPLIQQAIPLAYGDSYKGFRIIGTDSNYVALYDGQMASGGLWSSEMEVVIGSSVAENLNLGVGDHFHGTHGFQDEGHVHEEDAYTVVGVLEKSGFVVDRLILGSISSVHHLHSHDGDAKAAEEITALLIEFKSPMAMMQLPRMVNERTSMQAALPAIEINRLHSLLGVGFDTLRMIGLAILIVSALSVFLSLLNSLKDRRFELALLRTLGGSPFQLSMLLIFEALLLSVLGWLMGFVLARLGLLLAANIGSTDLGLAMEFSIVSGNEIMMLVVAGSTGLVSSLLPAIKAYRTNISEVLRND